MINLKRKIGRLRDALMMGGALDTQQSELHNAYSSLSKDELLKVLLKKDELLNEKDKIIEDLETEGESKIKTKDLELYDIINFYKFLRTEDGKLLSTKPELYAYDPFESAFDKNNRINKNYYRDYQKRFIEDWSISAQELVILYYGVGSGKTMIAVNCAEQFQEITKNAHIYFLVPASLVLGTIKEMYDRGIDPKRKNDKGEFIYYFVSYQQMLRSNFDFKENSLLIVDEAHNLRNIRADEISEKISGRKYKATGNYSLVGNKLSEKIILSSNKFLRTIFMTGTLFVNGPEDIEALMAIGYKKQPLLNIDKGQYEAIISNDREFKIYYEGLISFYRIPSNYPTIPKKHFKFIPIVDNKLLFQIKDDSYYMQTRNQGIKGKVGWILDFLTKHNKEKTLIYSQFLDFSIRPLLTELKKRGFKFGFISGELNQVEKLNVVKQYNDNEINILVFTLSIKEGISFKETNNIIVFQPYWNYAIMEQILARGIRLNSHKEGNKANINLYFLVAIKEEKSDVMNWFKNADKIMNDDIKTLQFQMKKSEGVQKGEDVTLEFKDLGPVQYSFGSRDIDLYNRMFVKQERINLFEKKLLSLPKFEEVNNNENNEFIATYKAALYEIEETDGKLPSNKELIKLKRDMYKAFYEKEIKKIDNRILRFKNDSRYRINRNPDLTLINKSRNAADISETIDNLVDRGAGLDEMFKAFNISKAEITQFQANFTPISEIEVIIKNSGIRNDTRDKIFILEPTAGIGNVCGELLSLPNKQNFMIDSNEFHSVFYQIGKAIYKGIDNIKWYNGDFNNYQNKYNYDYILGNPPFNIPYQKTVIINYSVKKGLPTPEPTTQKIDIRLYDVNFVTRAFNLLNPKGVLCMIMSDRFLRDDKGVFPIFKVYIEDMKRLDPQSINIEVISQFKADKGVTKEQETNFGMVCLTIKKSDKLNNFNIDLEKPRRVSKAIENLGIDENIVKEVVITKPRKVRVVSKK